MITIDAGFLLACRFLLLGSRKCYDIGQRPRNYPPGPPTLPLIGNLHQIPSEKRHLQFQKWALEYGPIYSLILGTKVIIVLNSDVAFKELVDRRGAVYSSRPEAILFIWPARRILSVSAARTYGPYQDLEKKAMLLGFLKDSGNFITTAALLDLVPALRTLPELILPIKREGKKIMVENNFPAYIGGSLLQAGSETTAAILFGLVQAITIFPDVAKAAQAELDCVCGDRMPDLNDFPNLPYIRACAKESLRWMPGFMLGIPHSVTQDNVYIGYHIPKGSTIIMNVWAVHNDIQRHPHPRRFDPVRYINDHQTSIDAANNPDATKRDHFVFGAGRRRCQGMHIANQSIFLAISPVDQETSKEIIPDINDMADGIMMRPKPVPAHIRPRSASKAEYIKQE
ncbi:cytochrome P450 [Periconia macrospinosa]|uniref:Cytochrome P450 n=1 Tax=Periconia macrospinosa TaxID=97972 RepID=A0A2V1DIJ9_9PLEO|nr:cytochrome P450 [Periconia macrospinosa]